MPHWLISWVASGLALLVLTYIPATGIKAASPVTAFVAAIVLGLVNTFIRPIIMFFAWPVNCLTFGLLGFAINAFLFAVVGSGIIPGFKVGVGIPVPISALIGSVAMGILSGLFSQILSRQTKQG